jgi:hypothetical protein
MVNFYKIVSYYLNTICPGRVIRDDNIIVGQKSLTEQYKEYPSRKLSKIKYLLKNGLIYRKVSRDNSQPRL